MKPVLAILLLHIACASFAQKSKMPDISIKGGPHPVEGPVLKRNDGQRSVTDVHIGNPYYSSMDTFAVTHSTYNEAGQLTLYEQYEYVHPKDIERWMPKGLSLKGFGTRKTYAYDDSGNVARVMTFSVLATNSYMLILDSVERWNEKGREDQHAGNTYLYTDKEKAVKAHGLLKAGLPEREVFEVHESSVYNRSNSLENYSTTANNAIKHYEYTYGADDRVKTQQEITMTAWQSYIRQSEHHLSYTPDGQLAAVHSYHIGDDGIKKNLVSEQLYYYNRQGLNDSIVLKQGERTITRRMGYKEGSLTSLTVVALLPATEVRDTVTHQEWAYINGRLTNWKHTLYENGKAGNTICEELFYDKAGLLTETKLYDRCDKRRLVNRHLFFYGKSS